MRKKFGIPANCLVTGNCKCNQQGFFQNHAANIDYYLHDHVHEGDSIQNN